MRLPFLASRDDPLNPELANVLGRALRLDEPDDEVIRRMRTRVAVQLRGGRQSVPASRGGFPLQGARRATVLASVFAALLMGSGVAAAQTPPGQAAVSAIKDTVASSVEAVGGAIEGATNSLVDAKNDIQGALHRIVPDVVGAPRPRGTSGTNRGDGLPGNLVTQLHSDGTFTVRGELTAAAAASATVRSEIGSVVFDITKADVHIPGGQKAGALAGFAGSLVFLQGRCQTARIDTTCVVERLTVLGQREGPNQGNGPGANSGNSPGANSGNGPGDNRGNGLGANGGDGPGDNSGNGPGANSGTGSTGKEPGTSPARTPAGTR